MTTAARKKAAAEKPRWPEVGATYCVRGYYTGEFIGQVESCDRDIAVLTVIDPLRPYLKSGCPFPGCIAGEDHDGAHLFASLCAGRTIEVRWKLARFEAPPVRVLEFRKVPA